MTTECHNLANINGRYSFARANGSPQAWHRLGQEMPAAATLNDWVQASGLDFDILESPVSYTDATGRVRMMDSRKVHFRSDTGDALAVQSKRFKLVQPREVAEFFQSVEGLETMGALRGGAVYWALVRLGDDVQIAGDAHRPYGLISTACDGTLATSVRQTVTRVVCANTLTLATTEQADVRVKHSATFDPKAAREAIGLLRKSYDLRQMREELSRMADTRVDDATARRFFAELLTGGPAKDHKANNLSDLLRGSVGSRESAVVTEERQRRIRGMDSLVETYYTAEGAAPGTAYGLLQGVTRYVDHVRGRDDSKRIDSAMFGQGARVKAEAYAAALKLAA